MSLSAPFLVIDGTAYYPRRPREYTAAILLLNKPGQLEERRAALKRVPEEFRAMVETQLQIAWNHPGRKDK